MKNELCVLNKKLKLQPRERFLTNIFNSVATVLWTKSYSS